MSLRFLPVSKEKVLEAVKFLYDPAAAKPEAEAKQNLLIDDPSARDIYLIVAAQKIFKPTLKPQRLPIPHSFRSNERGNGDVCLIVKTGASKEMKKLLAELKVSGISKVLDVAKFRTKYRPYNDRRQLSERFDLFLADQVLTPMLPRLVGKAFFSKRKNPIPVRLALPKGDSPFSVKDELEEAISSAYLFRTGAASTTVKCSGTNLAPEQSAENVVAALQAISQSLANDLENCITTAYVRTRTSKAIPVYCHSFDEHNE